VSAEAISFLRMAAVADKDTWFSIHHTVSFADGRPTIIPGNGHQRIRTAIEDAMYWAKRGREVYLAQGLFREAGPHKPGLPYPSAIRQTPNLAACKNLYMDIDVKPGAYATTKDALIALKEFVAQSKLPNPTIIVGSGTGGLHVYWTINVAFDVDEFRRMAAQLVAAGTQHGLMFDQQCTNDATRLLRIPGTWNFKGGPGTDGRPVKLLYCAKEDIDIDVMRAALSQFKIVHQRAKANPESNLNDDLTARTYPPIHLDDVAQDCPFIKHTLETGGEGYSEPIWKHTISLACHTDDPEGDAHRLSSGHDDYTIEGTDAKLGRAQQDRALRGIGPPLCATLLHDGVAQCPTCPHRDLGTTPLSLPLRRVNGHTHANFTTNKNPNSIDLPPEYYRGVDDLIYFNGVADDGSPKVTLVFEYQIIPSSGAMEAGSSYKFMFDTVQGEKQVNKKFDCAATSNNVAFAQAMHAQGLPLTMDPKNPRLFMANYLKQLQKSKDTLISVPAFGWSQDHKGNLGFAYAGKFISSEGEFKATKPGEGVENYRVAGDDTIWTGLMNIILTTERPDLAVMVATTFGAPLVGMTGEHGFLMGLWSTESGIGKTTSLVSGEAVWSKPIVGGLNDTVNYTFAKCATLRHLPIYIDEIKGEKQTKAMVELVFQLTGGREKGRSGRGGEMRVVREFETLCAYASNGSLVEAVREHHQGTDASWLRMFEMQAIVKPNDNINFTSEVQQRLTQLRLNFGGIGAKYAKYLGENQEKIAKALLLFQSKLAREIGADPQVERFWIAAMSTTMMGAYLANALKLCSFPLNEMKAYLVGEYHRMKQEMALNPNDLAADTALVNALGVFLTEKLPRNTVILDKTWTARTRPPKDYAKVLNDKTDSAWGPVEVQISGDPLVLKISDTALGQWCGRTKIPKAALVEQIKRKLNARISSAIIGSGSHRAGATQNVWVINATGTLLEDKLEHAIQYKLLPP
jgi:Domain of unknown function (DUF927)